MLEFQLTNIEFIANTPASVTANKKTEIEIITFKNKLELSLDNGNSEWRMLLYFSIIFSVLRLNNRQPVVFQMDAGITEIPD